MKITTELAVDIFCRGQILSIAKNYTGNKEVIAFEMEKLNIIFKKFGMDLDAKDLGLDQNNISDMVYDVLRIVKISGEIGKFCPNTQLNEIREKWNEFRKLMFEMNLDPDTVVALCIKNLVESQKELKDQLDFSN